MAMKRCGVRKLASVFGLSVLVLSLQYAFGVGACV